MHLRSWKCRDLSFQRFDIAVLLRQERFLHSERCSQTAQRRTCFLVMMRNYEPGFVGRWHQDFLRNVQKKFFGVAQNQQINNVLLVLGHTPTNLFFPLQIETINENLENKCACCWVRNAKLGIIYLSYGNDTSQRDGAANRTQAPLRPRLPLGAMDHAARRRAACPVSNPSRPHCAKRTGYEHTFFSCMIWVYHDDLESGRWIKKIAPTYLLTILI